MIETPSIGPIQGKVWGDTRMVFAWNGTSAHLIHIVKGGFCSRHSHKHRWNRFIVLRGCIAVRIWRDGIPDESFLRAGGVSDVPPGVRHQFEALEESEVIEMYWTVLDEEDIDRHDSMGGIRE
jgi:mannose-6-phosphate isomerase-like protein (cupin superfamily)